MLGAAIKCNQCTQTFATKGKLNSHKRTTHVAYITQSYPGRVTPYTFNRWVETGTFFCLCGHSSPDSNTSYAHIKGCKKDAEEVCTSGISDSSRVGTLRYVRYLRKHMQVVVTFDGDTTTTTITRAREGGLFQCLCKKHFAEAALLQVHASSCSKVVSTVKYLY